MGSGNGGGWEMCSTVNGSSVSCVGVYWPSL